MSAPTVDGAVDDTALTGVEYLGVRLSLVEQRVRQAVALRQATDPEPGDPLRGLHISGAAARRLIEDPDAGPLPDLVDREAQQAAEAVADRAEQAGVRVPLRHLAREFDLLTLDTELLLTALLPDLDRRYEKLYGYLNDDVTRPRATVGLAIELCGVPSFLGTARARLSAGCPLVDGGLLLVEDADRPFLTRTLRVPDRVTAHLLGDDRPDPRVSRVLRPVPEPGWEPAGAAGLAAAIRAGHRLGYVHDPAGGAAEDLAASALAGVGRPAFRLDLDAVAGDPAPAETVAAAVREARLAGAGLVAGPVDPASLNVLQGLLDATVPVVLTGRSRWDPLWAGHTPVLVAAPRFGAGRRAQLWHAALDGTGARVAADVDVARELSPYTLTAPQARQAATVAAQQALLDGADRVGAGHIRIGVRSQNAAGLEQLARRVEPGVGWTDLVVPEDVGRQLRDLTDRVRHREQVLGGWRLRPGGGRGRGVTGLFAGDSGTGKTMSAEVVAADLGLDLYIVDLSTVVDKYVGQTEKNLERIFTEAAGVNGVLLFDEADAIFGKRSEVSDAHDRYANMESAYLLQRMESFDGIAILTTNLRANLDEAFIRRLDVIVDFPVPDQAQRRSLWDHCLGDELPRADDVDLDRCARVYELSGGAIRACAVSAGYLAAVAGGPVTMAHLVAAAEREYRKMGRLLPTG
ncbi:ATP-binding protein [Actinoplanes teichomyceticus]|uniref:ATPase family protein associated with various cellular activities (AAA) n=1 Tax=Actinoplanes teichomyceticus TaxID=1867 RepID=A0A561WLJ0_ACTTI|nr:ATP-binding protein [Actinoplanes teichomyceticus]TWG24729.1 ATPase family protein associated with various cellular activities (AAA) [Actinoplanes teichomyceticus]GIF14606.1 ATPase [Actinoplanes teichomyceticus]